MFPVLAAYVTSADRLLCMNGTDGAVSGWDCFGMTIGSANAVSLNFDGTSRMKLDYASGTSTVIFFASNTSDQLQIETLGSQPIYLDTRGTGDGADVYLATTGYLGIGTVLPVAGLQVNATSVFASEGDPHGSIHIVSNRPYISFEDTDATDPNDNWRIGGNANDLFFA